MNYAEWTHRAREGTAPRPESLARVRQRLDRQLLPATGDLRSVPGPRPGAAGRVKARLQEHRQPRVWPARIVGATLLATAGVLAVALVDPGATPDRRIGLAGAGTLAVTDHVRLDHDGRGHIVAVGEDVSIDWEIGRLELDVDPGAGATVAVHTPEGTVRVVGTKFAVERDALGTRIDVSRGEVAVTCADGTDRALVPSESLECEPTTGAGLLNRARALEERQAGAEPILATVERGLADNSAPDAVRTELWTTKANVLVGAGRQAEALDAAEQALGTRPEAARAESLHRLAARLALLGGACSRAVPHLDALSSLTVEEQAYRERCK